MPQDCPPCAHLAAEDWVRVRTAMEHENGLTNQRVTWVLQSQGLLFAAYSLLTGKVIDLLYPRGDFAGLAEAAVIPIQLLMAFICLAGILICALLTSGVKAAHTQHVHLEQWWKEHSGHDTTAHPPICGKEPTLRLIFHYYHLPALFIPTWGVFLAGIWWANIHRHIDSWPVIAVTFALAYIAAIVLIYWICERGASKAVSRVAVASTFKSRHAQI